MLLTFVIYAFYSAGKYWSPRRPEDVPLQRPKDVPKRSYLTVPGTSQRCPNLTSWRRAEMTPGDVLIWRSWEIDSGCPQDDLVTSPRGPLEYSNLHAQFFLIFLFRTYLIDQIYLKVFQHSRCIKNPVKLLIWSIFCKINELLFSC